MKTTKTLFYALLMGAAIFTSSNVRAVQGTITVSGTALYQQYNTNKATYATRKRSFNQKDLLFLLEQATGDTTITNTKGVGKTVIIYDPDAFNYNAANSNQGYDFYGVFYYSNKVAGLTPLDGVDGNNDYYSYIEFEWKNDFHLQTQGFWDVNVLEYNAIVTSSSSKFSSSGYGLLYIHSDGYDYNLPNAQYYYANDRYGFFQQYAIVMHGSLQATWSVTSKTYMETLNLSGGGDGIWNYADVVVSGKAKFTGKQPTVK